MKTKKQIPYIWLGPIFTLGIILVIYAINGIYPFGGNSTAFSDGLSQFVPFLAELKTKLTEGGSLFFTWHASNGTNFWAIIAYYLASPLNLISLFFKPSEMDNAVTLLTIIKPVLASLTFSLLLKYKYNKNDLSVTIFSILWAMSGMFISVSYITSWFDAIIYFPLVILGLERMMNGKSAWIYSAFLALSIVSNFYMGWIICIFCLLYFVYLLISDDEVAYEGVTAPQTEESESEEVSMNIFETFKNSYLLGSMFKFALSSILAGGISAIFILPMWNAIKFTNKGNLDEYEVSFDSFLGLLGSLIFPVKNNYSTILARDVVFSFCGIASIILFVSFFTIKSISARKKVGAALLTGILFASCLINFIYYIWHGFGEPAGFKVRFAFIISFVILTFAYEAFIKIKEIKPIGFILGVVFSCICLAGVVTNETISVYFANYKNIILIVGFIVAFSVILIFLSKVKAKNVVTAVLLVAIIGESIVLNMNNINYYDNTNTLSENDVVESVKDKMKDYDSLTFVSKNKDFNDVYMYGMTYGYNALECYSSTVNGDFTLGVADMGIYGNRINSQSGACENTPIVNVLYPTKYYIDGSGRLTQNQFRKVVSQKDGYTFIENNYTMPFMYVADIGFAKWIPGDYPIYSQAQNMGIKTISGTDEDVCFFNDNTNFEFVNCEHIRNYDRVTENEEEHNENDGHDHSHDDFGDLFDYNESHLKNYGLKFIDKSKPAAVSYDSVATTDGIMYLYVETNEFTDMSVTLNGKTTEYYVYGDGTYRTYELGEVKKGDIAKITIGGYDPLISIGGVYAFDKTNFTATGYTVSMENFEKAYNKLDAMSDTEILEFSDTYVKAKVTSYVEGGIIYIPTTYDEGWDIYIDGEQVEFYKHSGGQIVAKMPEGEHTVEMKYTPKGFVAGAVITAVSVLILVAWAVISTKRFKKEQENVIINKTDVNED